jgi:hypothetical protein
MATDDGVSVFGIDPGVTTGWAFAKDVDLSRYPHNEAELDIVASQMTGTENQQAFDLFRLIRSQWPCAVIIEDFIPRKLDKSRHFLSPVRITEKLDILLWQDEKRHWRQMPSTAMGTITDNHLKYLGMWLPGEPHANDAQRHVLTYLRMLIDHPERHGQLVAPRLLD